MIDADQILADARAQTGLSDLGDDSILTPFRLLVDSVNSEAKLTAQGEGAFTRSVTGYLANRLRVEDWLKQHPELLDRPVIKPMFVFGLPRTGTTLTINLLNEDPARRNFLRWEAFDSVPPPKPEEMHAGPRYEKAQAQIDMSLKYAPHISVIHHEDGDSPCECQFSMAPSFCAQVFESQYQIPTYRGWLLNEADYRPAFQYQKRLFQLLQAENGGHWTLKNPWHPLWLDALTDVYPDAQLVMTHRDPVEVVGSACSLVAAVRKMLSDDVDLHQLGRDAVEMFETMIARQNAFRAERGSNAIYDVQYEEQVRDPIGTMQRLYAHFGEALSSDAEARMQAYMTNKPKDRFGKHVYDLADYGLTKDHIRERFAGYCRDFDIPTKA
jgi:Sulfotransferase family